MRRTKKLDLTVLLQELEGIHPNVSDCDECSELMARIRGITEDTSLTEVRTIRDEVSSRILSLRASSV